MRLLIPKEKAIKILQDRILGLDEYNFNSEAWKERTVLDLKEIFPPGSTQYIKIQFLNFGNYSVSKVAIRCKAFKTLLPFLIVVSITDLRIANRFAVSNVLN